MSNKEGPGAPASALLLAAGLAVWLCGVAAAAPPAGQKLIVFAASSLSDVMDDLSAAFGKSHPAVEVVRNYAASSTLTAQIKQGESADVYASANDKQMQILVDAGLVRSDAPAALALNRLVVIAPAANPAGVGSWEDLGRKKLALVLAAPGVPARDYADEIAARAAADAAYGPAWRARFAANMVSEEANVRQVAAKVALGEADAAIVYSTDVTPGIAAAVKRFEIPERFNVTARYPIAVLAASAQPDLAQAFVRFALSADGRALLARRGFVLPPTDR